MRPWQLRVCTAAVEARLLDPTLRDAAPPKATFSLADFPPGFDTGACPREMERDRESERERESVCVRERERAKARQGGGWRERERERE